MLHLTDLEPYISISLGVRFVTIVTLAELYTTTFAQMVYKLGLHPDQVPQNSQREILTDRTKTTQGNRGGLFD